MSPSEILILGCGYTGSTLARRLAAAGHSVSATARDPRSLAHLPVHALPLDLDNPHSLVTLANSVAPGSLCLHSIPVLDGPRELTNSLIDALHSKISRWIYISTTSVYGEQKMVDSETSPAPRTPAARLRLAAEQALATRTSSSLTLRAAAIYGPGRGAHISIPRGDFRLAGDGSNFVSRIHVEDLAALAEAALFSPFNGSLPAADLCPARSIDVARFVSDLLSCPLPPSATRESLHETRQADRRVDASETWRILGLQPRFPSFREGIPAALRHL